MLRHNTNMPVAEIYFRHTYEFARSASVFWFPLQICGKYTRQEIAMPRVENFRKAALNVSRVESVVIYEMKPARLLQFFNVQMIRLDYLLIKYPN